MNKYDYSVPVSEKTDYRMEQRRKKISQVEYYFRLFLVWVCLVVGTLVLYVQAVHYCERNEEVCGAR